MIYKKYYLWEKSHYYFLKIVSIRLSIKDIEILNNNIVIVDVEKIFLNVNNLNKISIDTT